MRSTTDESCCPAHEPRSTAGSSRRPDREADMTADHQHDDFHQKLHHIGPSGLISDTTQTSGMRRGEAISGKTVGSENLWMGQTHVSADTRSGNHPHGHSETAIYVSQGHPVFVFFEPGED